MSLINVDKSLPFKAAFKPLTVPADMLPLLKLCNAPLPALRPKPKINRAYKLLVTIFTVLLSLVNNLTTRLIGLLKSSSNL